jgi:hypothetical protein
MNIVEETVGVIRRASHGEGENQGDEENANGVIPIEQLETVILDPLVGVGPRTPADGAGNHHDERNAQTMWCKHLFGERSAKPSVGICRCQGQSAIDGGREQMTFPFPHSAVQLPRNIGRWAGPPATTDEAKNREFGGQHLNVGGEQQTFRDRRRCNW